MRVYARLLACMDAPMLMHTRATVCVFACECVCLCVTKCVDQLMPLITAIITKPTPGSVIPLRLK